MTAPLPLACGKTGRPLHVLITRPSGQAEETAQLVRELGGVPLIAPCLRLAPPEDREAARSSLLGALDQHPHAVAFASTNAVHATCRLLSDEVSRLSAPGLLLGAVGPQTAQALLSHGLRATVVADGGTGAALATALIATLRAGQAKAPASVIRVLLPRAEEGRTELAEDLGAAGFAVETRVVYRMLPSTPDELSEAVAALRSGTIDLLPLGSPRTAEVLLTALGSEAGALLQKPIIGAIGETTREALVAAGVEVDYALSPPAVSFRALLLELAGIYRRSPSGAAA